MTTVTKFEVGKAYVYSKSYDSGYFLCIKRTNCFVYMQRDGDGEVFRTKVSLSKETTWDTREDGSCIKRLTGTNREQTSTGLFSLSHLWADQTYVIGDELPKVYSL